MADFKTHITVSTALGIGYGAVAFRHFGVPAPTCVLAGTLCSVSGMLPDLDSDSGVPVRESVAFAAACVPMLLLERFRHLGWTSETIALAGAGVYLAIRFGIGKLLKKFTVHRGMFHSIPAAVIAGEVAFLVCVSGDIYMRAFKACAVVAGFMSHLILDEIWSVKFAGGRFQLKSSSGTALKFWGDGGWSNLATYGQMLAIGVIVLNDPIWSTVSPEGEELHTIASRIYEQFGKRAPDMLTNPLLPRGTGTAGREQPPPTTQYAQQPQQPYAAPQLYATQPNNNAQYDNSVYNNQAYGQPQYANPAPSGYVNNSAYSNPYGTQYSNSTTYPNSAAAPYSSAYPNNAPQAYPAPASYPQPSYPNAAPNSNYGTPSNTAYPSSVPYPAPPYPSAAANSQPPTYVPQPTSPQRY